MKQLIEYITEKARVNMTFVSLLSKTCEELNTKYDVNSGGCYYLAYVIASECDKRQIPYKIKAYYWNKAICDDNLWHVDIVINDKDLNPGEVDDDIQDNTIRIYSDKEHNAKWLLKLYK